MRVKNSAIHEMLILGLRDQFKIILETLCTVETENYYKIKWEKFLSFSFLFVSRMRVRLLGRNIRKFLKLISKKAFFGTKSLKTSKL